MISKWAYGEDRHIYSRDEFDGEYIEDWRKGKEGDWVLTDDGQVCQILKTRTLVSKWGQVNNLVVTILGTKNIGRDSERLEGEPPENIYTLSGKHPEHREKKRITPAEVLFVRYVLNVRGIRPWEAYKLAFQTETVKAAHSGASRLLRSKRVQTFMSKEISDKMDKLGVTKEDLISWAWNKIKHKKSNEHVQQKLWDRLCEMHAMFPENVKTSESLQIFQGWTPVAKKLMGEEVKQIEESDA